MGTYHDLNVYQRSYKITVKLYRWSMLGIPKSLQYDIGSDMRRAARSVPSNIVEGYSRQKSNRDIRNFLTTALGSNDEVLFNLRLLKDLKIIPLEKFLYFQSEYERIGRSLKSLIRSLN